MHSVCVCVHVHVVPILLMYVFVVRTYVALASSVLAVNICPVATATYVRTYVPIIVVVLCDYVCRTHANFQSKEVGRMVS